MAGKGGGAWKVAYADFVTAMMAFFLVMWICAQDQQIRQSVSHYFVDPFGGSKEGISKRPSRAGSLLTARTTGEVPEADSTAMGSGRNSYTTPTEASRATKWVSDWIAKDAAASIHWREEARRQRERARASAGVGYGARSAQEVAAEHLARQLKEEFQRDIPAQATPLQQDLLFEAFARVNWNEIAEDLLAK